MDEMAETENWSYARYWREQAPLLKRVLADVEWSGDPSMFVCPSCKRAKMAGHESWCDLTKALTDLLAAGVE